MDYFPQLLIFVGICMIFFWLLCHSGNDDQFNVSQQSDNWTVAIIPPKCARSKYYYYDTGITLETAWKKALQENNRYIKIKSCKV